MDLVFNQVRQLQHIGIANGNRLVEWFSRSPVEELYLTRLWQAGTAQVPLDIFFGSAIKHRRGDLNAQFMSSPAEVGFHNLSDLHTKRHTLWVQYDGDRHPIAQLRHVC